MLLREADITECQPDFVSGFQRSRREERWWEGGRGVEGVGDGGRGGEGGRRLPPGIKYLRCAAVGEPVWPSGKALGSGKRKDLGSIPLRLSSLFKKVVVVDTVL